MRALNARVIRGQAARAARAPWRAVARGRARGALCAAPRGNGRTSYHVVEALALHGAVPVYVYDDVPWLPYAESDGASSLNCSWVVAHRFASGGDDAASGRELASTLESLDDDAVERMRTCAKAHATTHFGKSGVIGEIASFLSGGERASSLRCAPLPEDSGRRATELSRGKSTRKRRAAARCSSRGHRRGRSSRCLRRRATTARRRSSARCESPAA